MTSGRCMAWRNHILLEATDLALTVYAAVADPVLDKNIGNNANQQFVTGGCASDKDCQAKCCTKGDDNKGVCRNKGALDGKTTCGFVDLSAKAAGAGKPGQKAAQGTAGNANGQNRQNGYQNGQNGQNGN
ncbi:Uncharacterized protein TPAR_00509 [Tolypocladium paradoxum]|uniref:Biotrophy-associated secreted protein 2 n=1 Tax=Tolypocladium paradoxum TaxID=94208 RepID=A0A2S4LA72_9HYPO|nr:Uncharacterized protein TPAR_00509 [Tolypocladium paradoxum]